MLASQTQLFSHAQQDSWLRRQRSCNANALSIGDLDGGADNGEMVTRGGDPLAELSDGKIVFIRNTADQLLPALHSLGRRRGCLLDIEEIYLDPSQPLSGSHASALEGMECGAADNCRPTTLIYGLATCQTPSAPSPLTSPRLTSKR